MAGDSASIAACLASAHGISNALFRACFTSALVTAPWLVPARARRYVRRMKLERLLFLMIASGAIGAACSADWAPEPNGSGGSTGETGTTGATDTGSTGQSGSGTSGTGSSGTSSGVGGGFPASCADTGECGNFGAGCIKCAAKVACSAEYDACFNDAPCKAYSLCLDDCGPKDLDCAQLCVNQSPEGAAEYQALIHCVLCGDCSTLCEHAPDTCK